MKSKNPPILLLFLIILTTGQLSANYAFKMKVKSTANSYRINIESKSLILDDPGQLIIELRSGRNNFEMFILVGFASAGGAIEHQKEMDLKNSYVPSNIVVVVEVPSSRGQFTTFTAKCSAEKAISLYNGETDSSQFMQEIMETIEIE